MGIAVEMFAVTKKKITNEQIAGLSYQLSCAFGYENFFMLRKEDESSPEYRALEVVEAIGILSDEDITEITPKEDETFVRVSFNDAFYNIGYERGNFPLYKNVAEWLEIKIPDAVIYYGGDTVYPILFDKEARGLLWKHYCEVNKTPYYEMFQKSEQRPICDFCNHKMYQHSFSSNANEAKYICNGCGGKLQTDDGGKSYFKPDII